MKLYKKYSHGVWRWAWFPKGSLSEKEYQINLDTLTRLIAEAQGD